MNYAETLRQYEQNPQAFEGLFQRARTEGQVRDFTDAVQQLHTETPDALLYQAWYYRLASPDARAAEAGTGVQQHNPNWPVAIGLSLLSAVVFWLLSDVEIFHFGRDFPLAPIVLAPIAALFVMLFLTVVQPPAPRRLQRLLGLGLLLTLSVLYVTWVGPRILVSSNEESYLMLAVPHLVLFAWFAVGAWLLHGQNTVGQRFAFAIKSFEVAVIGGLFVLAGGLFTAISFGLFETLGITVNDTVVRIYIAGGGGLIPVLAVALAYDPRRSPQAQAFQSGISSLIATLMRLMLPLALLLLVVYVGLIPFNFNEPFKNRDVLIVYNALLFAVIGLLLSATPVTTRDLSETHQRWLRRGLLALAALAVLISLYALAAIGYRTWNDGLTPNRVTVIGWNLVNMGLLILLLVRQSRSTLQNWLAAMQQTFAQGTIAYVLWAIAVTGLVPWFFMWAQTPIRLWRG
ncbi:MAG: hypothetical protein R3C14_18125 [Caldilineaceae bacterium]